MAFTGSHTTADGRTSPNAYAAPVLTLDHVAQRAVVEVRIWHDEAARRNGVPPIDTLTTEFRDEPNAPNWRRVVEPVRHKAERDAEANRAEAQACIERDPTNTKGRDDLLAIADSKQPEFEAWCDKLLGENWRQRYPTYADLFASEKQNDGGALGAWYRWAAKWHPVFSQWEST